MSGPSGIGKTLLARAASILPRMTPAEALDVTRIYSIAGMLPDDDTADLPSTLPRAAPHNFAGGHRRR